LGPMTEDSIRELGARKEEQAISLEYQNRRK
jgi:hypothetical protein